MRGSEVLKRKISIVGIILVIMLLLSANTYAAPKSPAVVVSEYKIEPEKVSPGDNFKIKLKLNNYGEYHARKVKITLKDTVEQDASVTGQQTEENKVKLDNFSPVNQSNVKYVSLIKADENKEIVYDLYASPKMEPGNYNLVLSLSYMDSNGRQYTDDQIIGILLSEKESIQLLGKDNYKGFLPGEPIESTVSIVNNGTAEVKGITVSVEGDGDNNQTEYLGNFNSGDFDSYTFDGIFEEAGEHKLKVKVSYIDSLNRTSEIEKELVYNIESNEGESNNSKEGKKGNWFTRFIKGIFGF